MKNFIFEKTKFVLYVMIYKIFSLSSPKMANIEIGPQVKIVIQEPKVRLTGHPSPTETNITN